MNAEGQTVIGETADLIKAVGDSFPQTVHQTDEVLETLIGVFNNIVLYPVKKANITFKYDLEKFKEDMKKKMNNISEENIQPPPIYISGPIFEGLRYSYDEETLRDMYENLLVSAMDKNKVGKIHPNFAYAIETMSPLDAKIIKVVAEQRQLRCGVFTFKIVNTDANYTDAMPNYFVEELFELGDPFLVSASLSNLERLAFIKIKDRSLVGRDYEVLKRHPYVVERFEYFKKNGKWKDIQIKQECSAIEITNLGELFADTCIR